jgi:hypothetical protein
MLPDAQFPLEVPPLAAHSLAVKHVPFIIFDAVDIANVHWLNSEKIDNFIMFCF